MRVANLDIISFMRGPWSWFEKQFIFSSENSLICRYPWFGLLVSSFYFSCFIESILLWTIQEESCENLVLDIFVPFCVRKDEQWIVLYLDLVSALMRKNRFYYSLHYTNWHSEIQLKSVLIQQTWKNVLKLTKFVQCTCLQVFY